MQRPVLCSDSEMWNVILRKVNTCIHTSICWLDFAQTRPTSHVPSETETEAHTHCSLSHCALQAFKFWLEQQVVLLISSPKNSALPPWGFISKESDWAMINLCCSKTEARCKIKACWRLKEDRADAPSWKVQIEFTFTPGEMSQSKKRKCFFCLWSLCSFYNAIQQGDNNVTRMQNLLVICKMQLFSSREDTADEMIVLMDGGWCWGAWFRCSKSWIVHHRRPLVHPFLPLLTITLSLIVFGLCSAFQTGWLCQRHDSCALTDSVPLCSCVSTKHHKYHEFLPSPAQAEGEGRRITK